MGRFAVNAYSEWKLNDTQLKIIACASMLADHICYVLFPYAKAAEIIRATAGRIAFPIYCFLLVEGFLHTKNRIFYCLRLAVFAALSEVFFDTAFFKSVIDPRHQNVFFTLLLGLLLCCILDKIRMIIMEKRDNSQKPYIVSFFGLMLQVLVILGFMVIAYRLKTDYSYRGILAIAAFYFFRFLHPRYSALAGITLMNLPKFSMPGAYLAVIFIDRYDHTLGKITKAGKYAFYAFYPAHLLVLVLLRNFLR